MAETWYHCVVNYDASGSRTLPRDTDIDDAHSVCGCFEIFPAFAEGLRRFHQIEEFKGDIVNDNIDRIQTIDAYIRSFPLEVQEKLRLLRTWISFCAPEATEKISYGIPTFYFRGNLIHFAAFKHHIGLYPGADGVAHFRERLIAEGYRISKGTIQFPNDMPISKELVMEIVKYRYAQQKNIKE